MNVAENLKAAMAEAGVSIVDLAKVTNMPTARVEQWLNGTKPVYSALYNVIAEKLDSTVAELFGADAVIPAPTGDTSKVRENLETKETDTVPFPESSDKEEKAAKAAPAEVITPVKEDKPAEVKTEAKAEKKTEPAPEVKTEPKPVEVKEPVVEKKTETKKEVKVETPAEVKAETKTEAKPAEKKGTVKTETKAAEKKAETKVEAEPVAVPADTETISKKAEPVAEPKKEVAEPAVKAEKKSEPKEEVKKTETKAEEKKPVVKTEKKNEVNNMSENNETKTTARPAKKDAVQVLSADTMKLMKDTKFRASDITKSMAPEAAQDWINSYAKDLGDKIAAFGALTASLVSVPEPKEELAPNIEKLLEAAKKASDKKIELALEILNM